MRRLSDNRSHHLRRTLNLVSFLANHPGVPVRTVCDVFALSTGQFMRAINEILMFGLPPYGPMDYVTAWVENGRVTVVNAPFLAKPLGLTVAEAVSLKVIVEDFISQSPGVFEDAAASLSRKIAALLGTTGARPAPHAAPSRKIAAIERGLDENRPVRISYYNRAQDALSERTVEPLGIVDLEGIWYLVAFCRLRGAERAFRMDRIREAQVLDGTFEPRGRFDIGRYRKDEMFFPSGRETTVRVRFGPESARWARERYAKWIAAAAEDGGVICDFQVADMAWISDVAVEFAPDARIEGPPEAVRAFRRRMAAVLDLYA